MRVQTSLLAVLAAAATAFAAPPDVCLPETVVPQPMPPTPTTSPIKVTADRVFVIQSKEPVVITSSKDGLLKVTQETDPDPANKAKLPQAPYRVTAKFADGPDKMVKRSFAGPYVYTVEPAKSGAGELLIIPRTVTADADMIRRDLVTDDGTGPIPPPVPPAPPVPPTPPAPAAVGTWVVIIANETTPDPKAVQVTDGPTARQLKADGKCRLYGTVSDAEKIAAKKYDKAMSDAKVTASCVLVFDDKGNTVSAFPLPATDADLAAKLKGVLK